MALVPRPVQTFWVEPCGRWRYYYWPRGAKESVDLGDFASEAEGDAAMTAKRAELEIESSGAAPLYRLPDGREVKSGELPAGAIRDVSSIWDGYAKGPDGLSLIVVCPDGWHWNVDSRASNCDRKDDTTHRCWCRHGDPRSGKMHVDKVGNTCNAGAGSILTGGWHGFLTHGLLQDSR